MAQAFDWSISAVIRPISKTVAECSKLSNAFLLLQKLIRSNREPIIITPLAVVRSLFHHKNHQILHEHIHIDLVCSRTGYDITCYFRLTVVARKKDAENSVLSDFGVDYLENDLTNFHSLMDGGLPHKMTVLVLWKQLTL